MNQLIGVRINPALVTLIAAELLDRASAFYEWEKCSYETRAVSRYAEYVRGVVGDASRRQFVQTLSGLLNGEPQSPAPQSDLLDLQAESIAASVIEALIVSERAAQSRRSTSTKVIVHPGRLTKPRRQNNDFSRHTRERHSGIICEPHRRLQRCGTRAHISRSKRSW
jgi:hypothetical protein